MNAEHTHKPVINMQECLNKNAGQIAVLRERVLLGYEPVIVFLHIMAGSNYPLLYINRPIKRGFHALQNVSPQKVLKV